jgi:hypothetical protein
MFSSFLFPLKTSCNFFSHFFFLFSFSTLTSYNYYFIPFFFFSFSTKHAKNGYQKKINPGGNGHVNSSPVLGHIVSKKWPKFARFRKKKSFQIARFLCLVPVGSQEYRRIPVFFFFFLLSYLFCSQIWLNHLMDDDRHFSYITKLTQKTSMLQGSCFI